MVSAAPPERPLARPAAPAGRVGGLDGARAIATLSVFLYHALWRTPTLRPLTRVLGHADIGVEVFFILSGFLVSRPLLAHAVAAAPSVRPVDFWRRRVARIWPAYLVALAGAVAVGIGTLDGAEGWLKHGLLVDSWFEDQGGSGLRPSWTLVVEVAFYAAILPLGALVALAGRRSLDAWVVLCIALGAFGSWALVQTSYGETILPLRVLPPFLPAFTAGMLLASAELEGGDRGWSGPLLRAIRRLAAHPAVCAVVAAGLFTAMAVLLRPNPETPAFEFGRERAVQSFLQVAVGFLAIAPLALRTARASWLERPVLGALGAASYGFYLWHLQVLRVARPMLQGSAVAALAGLGVAVAGAFLAGEGSRRLVEEPARRLLARPRARTSS